uniref:Uncharacterized protein n=1 Tax=Anopheles culicifacies TaxID=139723 RepID=A0A182MGC8_9DIPT
MLRQEYTSTRKVKEQMRNKHTKSDECDQPRGWTENGINRNFGHQLSQYAPEAQEAQSTGPARLSRDGRQADVDASGRLDNLTCEDGFGWDQDEQAADIKQRIMRAEEAGCYVNID